MRPVGYPDKLDFCDSHFFFLTIPIDTDLSEKTTVLAVPDFEVKRTRVGL
jgi:hypothetical protein